MSTSEYRSVDAEGDLPISAAELTALASQLFAQSIRPGPDGPPGLAPPAPRGSVPDTTSAASTATAVPHATYTPAPPLVPTSDVYVPAPTSPEPEGIPQTVPVAPRGSAPDPTAAPSTVYTVESALDPYAVPTSGIVPTIPGVLAGYTSSAPVTPRDPGPYWLPEAPPIPELDLGRATATRASSPVPQLPDEHEVFDVNAVRADF